MWTWNAWKGDATKILISGAGIAGPTLAYWLLRYGFEVTIVERAPRLRTGGYIIDFWGTGFGVAERMGLIHELRRVGYYVEAIRLVNAEGQRVGGLSVDIFRQATRERYVSLARGDLAAAIFQTIANRVSVMFGDHIVGLDQDEDGVRVRFAEAPEQRFDLVIGADGLHSGVRRELFGPARQFERFLGYNVAAFEANGYRPRDEDIYVSYGLPGKQVSRFAMRDDLTLFLLVYATREQEDVDAYSRETQERILQDVFGFAGWECPRILAALSTVDELYFDQVSQIHMDHWSRARVALVGDAAYCVSFLAGEGSGLAMTGAYVLAGELHRAQGRFDEAFARYEALMRPFVAEKQEGARRIAGAMVPRTAFGLSFRNLVSRLTSVRLVADLLIGDTVVDHFSLPDYD